MSMYLHTSPTVTYTLPLHDALPIFYLRLQELHDVVRTNHVDDQLIRRRKDAFRSYQSLTPPRVLTSDGEVVAGAYRRDDVRSEEHTSELQSHVNLVCRLLLEKKKRL